MTKKGHLILLLSLFLLSCLTAAAKQRSLDEALSIARHHAAKYGLSLDTNAAIHAKALRSRGIAGRKTDCYVFNNAGGKGFTVVSGSDLMPEIVGYARQGSFDADQLPEGLVAFMELYQATADAVEHGDARAIANVNEALRLRQSASRSAAVQPMLGEITWNQGAPFNNMCPIYDEGVSKRTLL